MRKRAWSAVASPTTAMVSLLGPYQRAKKESNSRRPCSAALQSSSRDTHQQGLSGLKSSLDYKSWLARVMRGMQSHCSRS